MEFKGTRGTWVLIKNDICSQEKIISTALGFIVEGKYTINEETKANALLISKAPEMLEMLNNQLEFLIYCRDNMKVSRPVFNQKILRIKQLIKEATEI
jgi:hypothetical protein